MNQKNKDRSGFGCMQTVFFTAKTIKSIKFMK